MKSIENYVDGLFGELPESERKTQLRNEIVQNLKDKVRDLMAQGKAEEDAVNKAIVEFGEHLGHQGRAFGAAAAAGQETSAGLALGFSLWGSALIIGLSCSSTSTTRRNHLVRLPDLRRAVVAACDASTTGLARGISSHG